MYSTSRYSSLYDDLFLNRPITAMTYVVVINAGSEGGGRQECRAHFYAAHT